MVSRRATFTLPLLLAALLLFLPVSSSLQSRPAHSLKKEVNQAADAAPRDLMAAFHAARYAVNEEPKVVELGGKPGLVAYSRKQNVRAIFAKDGVRVQTTGAAKSRPNVRLTPTALQRGAESQPLPAAAAPKAKGKSRRIRSRAGDGVVHERQTGVGTRVQYCGMRNSECGMGIPYSAPGLTTGATYSYRVRAYNGSGVSAWSEATGTVWRNIPLAPVQLRAIPITSSQILLVWKDIANENLYRIEAKPEGGAFAEIAQTRADVTTFAHNGLDAGATWIYRVRASNEAGATPTKRAAPPFRPCRRRPRA